MSWSLGLIVWVVFFSLIYLGIAFLVGFFFLRNLRDLLNRVSPQNRAMRPGQVWLNFIPIFNFGWMIYTVIKVRDSLEAEYRTRRWPLVGDFGYGVGMAFVVLSVVGWVMGLIPFYSTAVLSSLIGVGGFVCWIIYWVKTNGFKHRLGPEVLAPRYDHGPHSGPGYPGGPGAYGPPYGASLHCSACGAPYAPGDGFCRSCGQRLGSSAQPASATPCPACGATPDPGDAFCRSCGGDLR